MNNIHDEIHILQTQKTKLAQLNKEIMDSRKEMTSKLKSLTTLDWSPDMDSIIGSQTLAFFQQALHKFKTEINSVYTNEIKQFITNRQDIN